MSREKSREKFSRFTVSMKIFLQLPGMGRGKGRNI